MIISMRSKTSPSPASPGAEVAAVALWMPNTDLSRRSLISVEEGSAIFADVLSVMSEDGECVVVQDSGGGRNSNARGASLHV